MTTPPQVYGLTRTGRTQHILDRLGVAFCSVEVFSYGAKVAHMRVCGHCQRIQDAERKRRGE